MREDSSANRTQITRPRSNSSQTSGTVTSVARSRAESDSSEPLVSYGGLTIAPLGDGSVGFALSGIADESIRRGENAIDDPSSLTGDIVFRAVPTGLVSSDAASAAKSASLSYVCVFDRPDRA